MPAWGSGTYLQGIVGVDLAPAHQHALLVAAIDCADKADVRPFIHAGILAGARLITWRTGTQLGLSVIFFPFYSGVHLLGGTKLFRILTRRKLKRTVPSTRHSFWIFCLWRDVGFVVFSLGFLCRVCGA